MNDLSSIVKVLAVASAIALLQMSVAAFADEPSINDIPPPSTYATPPPFDNSLPSFPLAADSSESESGGEADPRPIEIPELSWQDDSVYIDFPSEDLEELPRWSADWFTSDVLDSGQVLDSGGGSLPSTPTMAEDIAAIRSYTEFVLFGLLPFCVAVFIFVLFAVWFYRTFIASAFR